MTAAASHILTGKAARGFTYISLMIFVAIIGLVTATAIKVGAVVQRAKAEQELLRIGAEFSDALQSYADATPAGKPSQPPSLKDLLKDPRFPTTRRHLRKLYIDPMTGKAEWGIVYLGDKAGIVAVYSLSDAKPVKIGNFPARFQGFDGKEHISDWKFTMTGKTATNNQAAPTAPVVTPQPKPEATPAALPPGQQEPAPAAPVEPAQPASPSVNPPAEAPPPPANEQSAATEN